MVILATWEDHGSRIAQGNNSQDPISKITRGKWTGGMAQAVELLLCECEALNSPERERKRNDLKVSKSAQMLALVRENH
jgi:hypothetical protein